VNICFEGEIWFCRVEELVEVLIEWLRRANIEASISTMGSCIILQGGIVYAKACESSSGMISSIKYESCNVEVRADSELCRSLKIILMRGGG